MCRFERDINLEKIDAGVLELSYSGPRRKLSKCIENALGRDGRYKVLEERSRTEAAGGLLKSITGLEARKQHCMDRRWRDPTRLSHPSIQRAILYGSNIVPQRRIS